MATSPAPSEFEIIAKFSVGPEACDDGIGEVRLVQFHDGGRFEVFVVAGLLPNGQERMATPSHRRAFAIFGNVVTQMLADEAADWE